MMVRVGVTVTLGRERRQLFDDPSRHRRRSRAAGSKRPVAFDTCRGRGVRPRSAAVPNPPAGVEGTGAGGRFKADEGLMVIR